MARGSSTAQTSQQRNAATPVQESSGQHIQYVESAHQAQKELAKALNQLHLQTGEVGKAKIDDEKTLTELRKATGELKKHQERLKNGTGEIMHRIHNELRRKVMNDRNDYVQKQMKAEIAKQVEEQVERQMLDFMPVTLDEQVRGAQECLDRLELALRNSKARDRNGSIKVNHQSDWNEKLGEVFKDDGSKSEHYPFDLSSLFNCGEEKMRMLLADYVIEVDASQHVNFNRFVQFIGVQGVLGELV